MSFLFLLQRKLEKVVNKDKAWHMGREMCFSKPTLTFSCSNTMKIGLKDTWYMCKWELTPERQQGESFVETSWQCETDNVSVWWLKEFHPIYSISEEDKFNSLGWKQGTKD